MKEPKYIINRQYKYDRAMIEAIKRIPVGYPVPISMVSNVKEFINRGEK